ncbi:MAG: hypothetical protein ACRDP6_36060 [Actinoallomurus sp.]
MTTNTNPAPTGQATPFALQASSELSTDYFQTDDVILQDGDRVIPFVDPMNDNAVEAIVFTQPIGDNPASVNHLQRDLSAPSGWNYTQVNLGDTEPAPVPVDVAVAADADNVYLMVLNDPNQPGPGPAWLSQLDSATGWDDGYFASYEDLGYDGLGVDPNDYPLGPLKGGIDQAGHVYFYAAAMSNQTTYLIGWVPGYGWDNGGFNYQLMQTLDTTDATVTDYIVLFDTSGVLFGPSGPAQTGYSLVLTSDTVLAIYQQQTYTNPNTAEFGNTPMNNIGTYYVTELIWAWATPDSTTGQPGYVIQRQADQNNPSVTAGTVFVDENGNDQIVSDQSSIGNNAVAVWLQDNLYTVNVLDPNGTLSTISQTGTGNPPAWGAAVPIVPNVAAVFGVPTDPNEATLFAIVPGETEGVQNLCALTQGPSGWTQTRLHQDGTELYEAPCYRVQVQVLDANGVPVLNGPVSVTADQPVGCWTPAGQIPVNPGTATTMYADAKGEITLSIPAEELDCATFTMQALDVNGDATGAPFTVTPDTDVRAFLGGTGSLSDQGTLTPDSLINAQNVNSDGSTSPVFGNLASMSGSDQQNTATSAVSSMNQIVAVGNKAQNGDMTGTGFTVTTTTSGSLAVTLDHGGTARLGSGTPELGVSLSHVFDSIGHGLRHAAMGLSQAVVHLADDASAWLVDLTVQIGDDIVNYTDLVISDMKDAFHIIGGFFQSLGADIKAGVEWLTHNVIDLLKAAKASAEAIQGWLDAAPGNLSTVIAGCQKTTDAWFSGEETAAHNAIANLETTIEDETFGSAAPLPPMSSDTGSSSDESKLSKAIRDLSYIVKVINDTPGKWLMDKYLSYMPPDDPGPPVSQDTWLPVLNSLAGDWQQGMTFSASLLNFAGTTLEDAASPVTGLNQMQMTTWFEDLANTVDDGLQLMDAICDTLFDVATTGLDTLQSYLTYQYSFTSSMGILGLILELVGVDLKYSVDEIMSWIIAFPATLVARCSGYDTLFPTSSLAAEQHAVGDSDPGGWQVGLGIAGAVAQGVWAFADLSGDLQQLADLDPDTGKMKRGTPSSLIDIFDAMCPVAETIFLWPSKNSDGPPFNGGIADNTTDWELLPFAIYSALIPTIMIILSHVGWTNLVDKTGFPSDVQDVLKDYMAPVVQMMSGIANTVLSLVYEVKNDNNGSAIAASVLGNLSFIFAPFATKWMNETTDDVSCLIKMAIDMSGNLGAAICIGESSSLPVPD